VSTQLHTHGTKIAEVGNGLGTLTFPTFQSPANVDQLQHTLPVCVKATEEYMELKVELGLSRICKG